MPLLIDQPPMPPLERAEFCERFRELKIKPGDDAALEAAAPLLSGLFANRQLAKEVAREALDNCLAGAISTVASPQTIKVADLGDGHYLRMVYWPSKDDEFFSKADNSIFYYGKPHDHNFSFLTVGYDGPGYSSDYYEIPAGLHEWYPGCDVTLDHIGEKTLHFGSGMLYRRHVDVHSQKPPAESSISINIMSPATIGPGSSQFIFNADCTKVEQLMQSRFNPVIFALAASQQDHFIDDRLQGIAMTHPDPLVQYYALKNLVLFSDDESVRESFIAKGCEHPSAFVQNWMRSYIDTICHN